jgi:hypothetical protein
VTAARDVFATRRVIRRVNLLPPPRGVRPRYAQPAGRAATTTGGGTGG